MALISRPSQRAQRAIWLTHAGLWLEAVAHAFWPLWAGLAALAGALMLGADWPGWGQWLALAVIAALAVRGVWVFRRPRQSAAEARIDDQIDGRPLSGLRDMQASGQADAGSVALWQAHQDWLAGQSNQARMVAPNLRLAAKDPFGLRLIGMLVLAVGLIFGSAFRATSVTEIPTISQPGGGGPSWEGWAEPPSYTGELGQYLPDTTGDTLTVPQGTAITLRFYGAEGAYDVTQDIGAGDPIIVAQSGKLAVSGPDGKSWQITMIPDAPPVIALDGDVTAQKGETVISFTASDDYGVRSAQAVITLDLDQVDRRYGLAIPPDDIAPLQAEIPMPYSRDRQELSSALREDFSQHVLANMPVIITVTARDDADQTSPEVQIRTPLHAKRFFQPIARAIAEQRRDFLWAQGNDRRVTQVLRAIAWQPDTLFRNPAHGTILRGLIDQIEDGANDRQAIADGLWALALELEEGSLEDARARLRRAQERLAEAMRNGASDAEIAELMDELRAAKEDYMRLLAENAEPADQGDQPDTGTDRQTVTQDEIDRLMDEIQRLMEEGRMDEARALMEQLNELLENLTMQQSQDGSGDGPPGQQSMEDLGESLREQQELSDETFRELQDRFNGRTPPQQDQQGQPEAGQSNGQPEGGGQDGAPDQEAPDARSLAERQEALRDELARQRQALPGLPGDQADAARRALDRAGEAMDRAGEALERDDLPGAINNQGRALELMREGMTALSEAMREAQQDAPNDPEGGGAQGQSEDGERVPARDPLGRSGGGGGQMGGDPLPDAQSPDDRAAELQDELRRRLGERARPKDERDYFDRLLDRF